DRDRGEGDARRVRRGDARDRPRGRRGPRRDPLGTAWPTRQAPRRGTRRQGARRSSPLRRELTGSAVRRDEENRCSHVGVGGGLYALRLRIVQPNGRQPAGPANDQVVVNVTIM